MLKKPNDSDVAAAAYLQFLYSMKPSQMLDHQKNDLAVLRDWWEKTVTHEEKIAVYLDVRMRAKERLAKQREIFSCGTPHTGRPCPNDAH